MFQTLKFKINVLSAKTRGFLLRVPFKTLAGAFFSLMLLLGSVVGAYSAQQQVQKRASADEAMCPNGRKKDETACGEDKNFEYKCVGPGTENPWEEKKCSDYFVGSVCSGYGCQKSGADATCDNGIPRGGYACWDGKKTSEYQCTGPGTDNQWTETDCDRDDECQPDTRRCKGKTADDTAFYGSRCTPPGRVKCQGGFKFICDEQTHIWQGPGARCIGTPPTPTPQPPRPPVLPRPSTACTFSDFNTCGANGCAWSFACNRCYPSNMSLQETCPVPSGFPPYCSANSDLGASCFEAPNFSNQCPQGSTPRCTAPNIASGVFPVYCCFDSQPRQSTRCTASIIALSPGSGETLTVGSSNIEINGEIEIKDCAVGTTINGNLLLSGLTNLTSTSFITNIAPVTYTGNALRVPIGGLTVSPSVPNVEYKYTVIFNITENSNFLAGSKTENFFVQPNTLTYCQEYRGLSSCQNRDCYPIKSCSDTCTPDKSKCWSDTAYRVECCKPVATPTATPRAYTGKYCDQSGNLCVVSNPSTCKSCARWGHPGNSVCIQDSGFAGYAYCSTTQQTTSYNESRNDILDGRGTVLDLQFPNL